MTAVRAFAKIFGRWGRESFEEAALPCRKFVDATGVSAVSEARRGGCPGLSVVLISVV